MTFCIDVFFSSISLICLVVVVTEVFVSFLSSLHLLLCTFHPPSTTLKGDIETVTVRLSFRPSFRPSVRKESPLTATTFHRSLPNFYSIFISLKNFIICSFIKKWQKLLPWQPFFLSFNAYLPMSVPYMKA